MNILNYFVNCTKPKAEFVILNMLYKRNPNIYVQNLDKLLDTQFGNDIKIVDILLSNYGDVFNYMCTNNIIKTALKLAVKFSDKYFVELNGNQIVDHSKNRQSFDNIHNFFNVENISKKIWWQWDS